MHTKENIKLIVLDMDGTLLNHKHQISKGNVNALRKAAAKGIQIAICSGRLCGDISLYALDAGLDTCRILSLNGAYCLERPNGIPYASHTFARDTLESCLGTLTESGVGYSCFWGNRMVSTVEPHRIDQRDLPMHEMREGAPEFFSGREALERAVLQGISKILYVEEEDMKRLEKVREGLLTIRELDVTSSWGNNLELMPQGVCKGSAVKELATRLDIPAENVMAIGDYDNDISMIAYAGCGVAMANATRAVLREARHVTLSNAEDGVAEAIYRYAL